MTPVVSNKMSQEAKDVMNLPDDISKSKASSKKSLEEMKEEIK